MEAGLIPSPPVIPVLCHLLARHIKHMYAEEMLLLPVLLLTGIGLVIAEDPINITGHLGLPLHLPIGEAYRSQASYRFDLSSSSSRIGSYDDGIQGLNGYNGRLSYNKENGTITLDRLTEGDGITFNVTLQRSINNQLRSQILHYLININEHSIKNVTSSSTDGVLTFVSFCLSLDSPVNTIALLVCWLIQGKYNNLDGDSMDLAGHVNSCFTIAFQVFSIVFMSIGNAYGWLLLLVPISLLVHILKHFEQLPERVLNALQIVNNMDAGCKTMWKTILLLIQILFAVFVGLLYNTFDQILELEPSRIGFLCLSVILSAALKLGVFFSIFRFPFSQVSSDETKSSSGYT
ncbi:uncharacterized protein [Dendropsophus ebraccatus]|uniref:uncharacterized protein isoform X2 n=1 Tax=Dendropsophus ebraccatus TaxID=150705 RepID=UPI0038317CD4